MYISYFLVPLAAWYFYKTRSGLFLRAMGENPAAVDAAGINVFGLRYLYIVVGGALAGVAGAYLSLAYAPSWLENMTAGRGWIAVALVIDALGFNLQVLGVPVSGFILNMLPYIFTVLVLVLVLKRRGGRSASPQALGLSYDREER